LQLGTLIHAAHATWIEHPERDPAHLFAYYAQQDLARIRTQYHAQTGMNISEDELDATYENIKLGAAMMTNYKQHWKSPLDPEFIAIAPEQTVIVPIPYSPHQIEATLDTLLQHRRTGQLFVHERKTYGQRPTPETLNTSDQFLGYLWVAQQLGIGQVGGIAYDGLWKRAVPPRGRTLDDLFLRLILTREPSELTRFEADLRAEAEEMANPNTYIYLNRRWEGCYDCGMSKLCLAETRDEDTDYVRKEYYTARTRTKPAYEEMPVPLPLPMAVPS